MSLLPTVVRNSTRSSSSPKDFAAVVCICLRIAPARSFATESTPFSSSSSSDISQVTLSPHKPKYRLHPHPRPASHTSTTDSVRVSPGLKHLPATFGKNQLLPVSNDTRALLESIVARFEAPIRYAFAYGSGVFEQDGYNGTTTIPAPSLVGKGSEMGGTVAFEQRPMVDFMFAVTHAAHFHSINMQQFPSHYPLHSRLLGSSYVSKMQDFGPGVWFNAYIPMNGAVRISLYFYSQSDIL